jgi:hypothetical protein
VEVACLVRRDGSYVKVERLKQIGKEIARYFPEPVDYHKMVLWVEMNIGLSPVKAVEYIDKVIEAHGWIVEDGKIKPS